MEIKQVFCKRCGHAVGRSATQCPMCGRKTKDPLVLIERRVENLEALPTPKPPESTTESLKAAQADKPKPIAAARPRPGKQKVAARSIPRQPKKKGCGCCSGCFTIIIAIGVVLGFLIFNPGAIDLPPEVDEVIDDIRHEVLDLFDAQTVMTVEEPADVPARPKLVVNKEYRTRRGYLAAKEKEFLLQAIEYKKNGNGEGLQALRSDRLIGNMKAGRTVIVLGIDPQNRWVYVKSISSGDRLYVQPGALVE